MSSKRGVMLAAMLPLLRSLYSALRRAAKALVIELRQVNLMEPVLAPNDPRHNWITFKANVERHAADRRTYTSVEREASQLLHACLLYQLDGLSHLHSDRFHRKWRDPSRVLPLDLLVRLEEPFFGGLLGGPSSEAVAEMHLASAAIRLPVMLQKTIEARPSAAADFGDLWGVLPGRAAPDWRRSYMKNRFANVKTLDHCAAGVLGVTEAECLQHALTIVTLLRDDFGHGEEGDGTDYMKQRGGILDTVYACRIVEAETVLIRWAIKQLG